MTQQERSHPARLISQSKGNNFWFGNVTILAGYIFKGDKEKVICHFEIALGIASYFNWFFSLVVLFSGEDRLDDAPAHFKHARSYAVNDHDTSLLAHAIWLQAGFWYR